MTTKSIDKKVMSSVLMLLIVFVVLILLPQKNTTIQILPNTQQVIAVKQNSTSLPIKNSKDSLTITPSTNQPTIHSYKGSKPDGAINLDINGMIIVDHDLKRLFDYYFTAIGELSIGQIKNQLKLFSQDNLDSFQLAELMNLFDQYSQYLNAYDKFTQNLATELSQVQRLALISDFRIESLGTDMAAAFFANEESYIAYVLSDKQTDDGQWNEQQIAWLESENNATEYLDAINENQIFEESGSINAAEIYDYRVQQYGEQAALRLTQLDNNRKQWQQTLAEYNAQRQLIENKQSSMTLIQLHAQYTAQQVRRLSGLWRL